MTFFKNTYQGTFRNFIAAWLCFIVSSVLASSVAIFITGEQLKGYVDRIRADAQATESTYILESVVLARCREELQWRLDRTPRSAVAEKDPRLAEQSLSDMAHLADSGQEMALVQDIIGRYRAFLEAVAQNPPDSTEHINHLAGAFLESVRLYRKDHKARVVSGLGKTLRLDRYLELWPALLVFAVAAIAGTGAMILLQRIAGPAIDLTRAAVRFGQGNYTARVSVKRNDELGRLCATFNNMADDISNREEERLHLIASIVHDIKNPLVSAGCSARLLQREPGSRKHAQWVDNIVRQVATVEEIVHDLMDSVQVETGKLSLNIREVDLASLLQSIQNRYNGLSSGCPIIYEGYETCLVPCDEHRMERVLVNLISNAVKYSPAQSPIFLKAVKNGAKAVVSVRDQGVGINPENLTILFQPFGRIRRSQHMSKGNGLGLFVVKKIVEAHEGTIKVMSRPGAGTTFEIILPAHDAESVMDSRVTGNRGSRDMAFSSGLQKAPSRPGASKIQGICNSIGDENV